MLLHQADQFVIRQTGDGETSGALSVLGEVFARNVITTDVRFGDAAFYNPIAKLAVFDGVDLPLEVALHDEEKKNREDRVSDGKLRFAVESHLSGFVPASRGRSCDCAGVRRTPDSPTGCRLAVFPTLCPDLCRDRKRSQHRVHKHQDRAARR